MPATTPPPPSLKGGSSAISASLHTLVHFSRCLKNKIVLNVVFLFFFAVVLLDTTKEDSLDWTRYPFGPQSATPGVSIFIHSIATQSPSVCEQGQGQ